jgi:hypothetical protein
MLPRYIPMGGKEAYQLNFESFQLLYTSLTGTQWVSLAKNTWGKLSIDPYNLCLSCLLFCFVFLPNKNMLNKINLVIYKYYKHTKIYDRIKHIWLLTTLCLKYDKKKLI